MDTLAGNLEKADILVNLGRYKNIELVCHALGAEYFFETRLPNCIEGAVNISNCGFGSVFLYIVFLFD